MRKRITALLIALGMISVPVMLLSSCADNSTDAKTSAPVRNNDPNKTDYVLSDLPQVDMKGAVISFAISEADNDGFHQRSIVPPDEEVEDPVDVAVFTRNEKIKRYFNCEIELVNYVTNMQSLSSAIGSQLMAGTSDYDILGARQYDDVQLALTGCVYDLSKLAVDFPDAANYMNLDAPYWAKAYNDALQIGNGRYWVTGDLCLRYSGGYYCYFVNHTLYNQYLEKEYGSIYDVVRKGDWTLDTLLTMTEGIWNDDDGNDKTSSGDMLAIAQPVHDNINGLSISAGVQYSYRYDDGSVRLTFIKGNKTLETFMNKFYNLLQKNGVYNYADKYDEAMKKLVANKAVFVSGRLNQAELYLQEMEDNYGIVPNPKLSSEQKDYISSIHDAVQLYGINNGSEQIPEAALVLDAMELESRNSVRPVYFDSAVKIKYSRGSDDADMIDLMDSVIYSDFVYVWQFSSEFQGLGDFLRSNIKSPNGFNAINKQQTIWGQALTAILERIKRLEEVAD